MFPDGTIIILLLAIAGVFLFTMRFVDIDSTVKQLVIAIGAVVLALVSILILNHSIVVFSDGFLVLCSYGLAIIYLGVFVLAAGIVIWAILPTKLTDILPTILTLVGAVFVSGWVIYHVLFIFLAAPSGATTQNFNWTIERRVDAWTAYATGAWQNDVPSNAYNQNCYDKEYSRSDDTITYHTWCDYTIDTWIYNRSVTTNGSSQKDVMIVPSTTLSCVGKEIYGCEQGEDNIIYSYYISLVRDGTEQVDTCSVDNTTWMSYYPNEKVVLDYGVLSNDIRCNSLRIPS